MYQILGADGRVLDGKGEGMYIGALLAANLIPSCEWVIYYDADNFFPCALLEYSFAMARLFTSPKETTNVATTFGIHTREGYESEQADPPLHNVRICWASKPSLNGGNVGAQQLGRCSKVVSPLVSRMLSTTIVTSNAGEQGMTLQTALSVRFTSKYSIETFLLLELFARGLAAAGEQVVFQQYMAQSPHFHEKGDEKHIDRMIAQSLGCFSLFTGFCSPEVEAEVRRVCAEKGIIPELPKVYPALEALGVVEGPTFLRRYELQVAQEQIGKLAGA